MAQGASLLATWASRLGFGAACAAAGAAAPDGTIRELISSLASTAILKPSAEAAALASTAAQQQAAVRAPHDSSRIGRIRYSPE